MCIRDRSYSVLQDDFFHFMRNAGYTDVERGERGSAEEHLSVTQFKVQAEQQRLEAVTGQVAQAEQSLEDTKAATEKQKKKLEALQKETKTAKTIAPVSYTHLDVYKRQSHSCLEIMWK